MAIMELLKGIDAYLMKEYEVIEIFRKNAHKIEDKRVFAGLSVLTQDSLKHAIELTRIKSEIQQQLLLDLQHPIKGSEDEFELPLNTAEIAEILADLLKEEKAMQIRYKQAIEKTDHENMKKHFQEIIAEEQKHEKIVKELIEHLK